MGSAESGSRWVMWIGIALAIPGCLVAMQQLGWLTPDDGSSVQESGQQTVQENEPAEDPLDDLADSGKVRWAGSILLTESETDLDVLPPDNGADDGGDIELEIAYGLPSVPGKSGRWEERAGPTARQCAERIRTSGNVAHEYESPTPGMRICVQTDGGRIALVRLETPPTYEEDAHSAEAYVTVWQNKGDAAGDAQGPTTSNVPADGEPRWKGDLLLTDQGMDLDLDPPTRPPEPDEGDVRLFYEDLRMPVTSARWTGEANPTPQRCAELLLTAGLEDHQHDSPTAGNRYCLETDGGRLALVRMKGPITYADDVYSAPAHITVWPSVDG